MKAHLSAASRLSRSQVRVVSEFASEEIDRQRVALMRRFFKLMALALRDPLSEKGHGMGAAQIGKVMQRIGEYAAKAERNPEFWEEVDHVVVDRMGLTLEKE